MKPVFPVAFWCLTLVGLAPGAAAQGTYQLTTLHRFVGGAGDGALPYGDLVKGADGRFYGTTRQGGSANGGTVFAMTPAGALTTLYAFTAQDSHGAGPTANLVEGADGRFYGTTYGGGNSAGEGTVFAITPAGALTTLHNFVYSTTNGTDGAHPIYGLARGTDGLFYGTTADGNAYRDGGTHSGFVFSITADGALTYLHNFYQSPDIDLNKSEGTNPGRLTLGRDGRFYGVNHNLGGSGRSGTVFAVTTGGALTVLHRFLDSSEGDNPSDRLVQGSDGRFYGVTQYGGIGDRGVVFAVDAAGGFTVLHRFSADDGTGGPTGGLIQGQDGRLYGTTSGAGNPGTVYAITPAGLLTILYRFTSATEGNSPQGALFQDDDGSFYGTTVLGGNSYGTVFKLVLLKSPVITSATTATATTGQAFSYQITATNSPTSFATSSVPPGLSFSTTTGRFTGVPTQAGTYKPLLAATNSAGTGRVNLTLTVKLGPPVITSATSATATVGKPFSYQITAINNPTSFATSSVPPGLSFDKTTGKFTGTPTQAGTYKPLLAATNSAGSGRVNLELTVNPAPPVITSSLMESAQVGVAFSYQVTATNSPTKYAISSLPPGLTFNTATGKLSGTPTKAGSYRPLVAATNAGGTGSANVSLTVKPAKPQITSELDPPARQGVAFSYQITATNSPTSYATSSVPPGLSFSTSTGKFTGTPTKAGTYKPLISATNSGGTGSVNLNLVVMPPS